MQISLTDANGSYNIFLEEDFDTLDQYVELLIKPILRAASFGEGAIARYFINEDTISDWTVDFDLDEVLEKKTAPVAKKAV
jgi:hypothetical protein